MTTDSLQPFMKGIGKVRLLSPQDEIDFAKRIERGEAGRETEDSSPTCGWSSRSRRTAATRDCRSST
jgi:hypothetical protein